MLKHDESSPPDIYSAHCPTTDPFTVGTRVHTRQRHLSILRLIVTHSHTIPLLGPGPSNLSLSPGEKEHVLHRLGIELHWPPSRTRGETQMQSRYNARVSIDIFCGSFDFIRLIPPLLEFSVSRFHPSYARDERIIGRYATLNYHELLDQRLSTSVSVSINYNYHRTASSPFFPNENQRSLHAR